MLQQEQDVVRVVQLEDAVHGHGGQRRIAVQHAVAIARHLGQHLAQRHALGDQHALQPAVSVRRQRRQGRNGHVIETALPARIDPAQGIGRLRRSDLDGALADSHLRARRQHAAALAHAEVRAQRAHGAIAAAHEEWARGHGPVMRRGDMDFPGMQHDLPCRIVKVHVDGRVRIEHQLRAIRQGHVADLTARRADRGAPALPWGRLAGQPQRRPGRDQSGQAVEHGTPLRRRRRRVGRLAQRGRHAGQGAAHQLGPLPGRGVRGIAGAPGLERLLLIWTQGACVQAHQPLRRRAGGAWVDRGVHRIKRMQRSNACTM